MFVVKQYQSGLHPQTTNTTVPICIKHFWHHQNHEHTKLLYLNSPDFMAQKTAPPEVTEACYAMIVRVWLKCKKMKLIKLTSKTSESYSTEKIKAVKNLSYIYIPQSKSTTLCDTLHSCTWQSCHMPCV